MQTINLYKYTNANGCVVTPVERSGDYAPMFRLVADEGKALTSDGGITHAGVVDIVTDDLALWQEIDAPIEDEEVLEDMTAALRTLGVSVDG